MINSSHKRQLGISLIEALIAVVILSFGMLALASLQAQLFRAGAETKARATATAFAQGRIEAMRSFRTLSAPSCPADNPFCDYKSIDTGSFGGAEPGFEVAGVTYYGCTQVRRFRRDDSGNFVGPGALPDFSVATGGAVTCDDAGDPAAGAVVSSAVPEFKEVTANIGWFDQNGELKRIQLTDTIAAISPDDALQLAKSPPAAAKRPIFEIDRASLNATPGIVPIATGDNRTAASTNPTPKQYVDQLSSLTTFDVMNFVGAGTPDILKVTRNISMSAVSCVCSNSGATASDALPAFEPTVFNGKRMAYETPERKPNGLPVGSYVGSSSDSAIKSICTVCCRDHHDSNKKRNPDRDANLRVDPYRTLDATAGSHPHYGFQKQGQGYVIDGGLLPVGSVTDNEYVEACKVVEVDGRLRLSVDARQNNLTLAAMDASQSGFEQADFVQRYSNFVKDYVAFAIKGKPANYPVAPTALPAPDTAVASAHSTILEPATIDYEDASVDRKALGFGLYIDYLSADTLEVYEQVLDCKTRGDTTSDECKVLGFRDPLEFVPFFALNLASLGEWNTDDESVVDIYGATYTPQGTLENQGGLVKWGAGSSQEKIPGSEKINISNSGLTATVPVDLDDGADQSFVTDWLSFIKAVGNSTQPPKSLVVKVAASSTITLQKIGVSSPAGVTPCDYTPKGAASTCSVPAGASTTTLRLSNFTTSEKVQGSTVIHDRQVCLTNDKRIVSAQTYFPGTVNEYIDLQIDGMNTTDHVLTIEIMDASDPCSPGQVSLTPAN